MKKYVQDYFEKAVAKKKEHDKKKADRKAHEADFGVPATIANTSEAKDDDSDGAQDMAMSEDEDEKAKQDLKTPITPLDNLLIAEGLKRKRESDALPDTVKQEDEESTPSKRFKSETPPPPPPPPPGNDNILDNDELNEKTMQTPSIPYDSPKEEFGLTGEPLGDDGYHPPPPPPPNRETNDTNGVGGPHIQDSDDARDIAMDDDEFEHPTDHERHFSGHQREHFRELQVSGGA